MQKLLPLEKDNWNKRKDNGKISKSRKRKKIRLCNFKD